MLRGVLREIDVRRVPGEPLRRWFMSVYCDLIVWVHGDETPLGFQFGYDKDELEQALTWTPRYGYSHQTVDKAGGDAVPLLVPGRPLDRDRVLEMFREEAILVPDLYIAFVSGKISALLDNMTPLKSPRGGNEAVR